MNGWMDRCINELMGLMDRRMDGWIDMILIYMMRWSFVAL